MNELVLADALGPRGRRRVLVASVASSAVLAGAVALALARFGSRGQLEGDRWSYFFNPDVMRFLGVGLLNTLRLAAVSMTLAFAAGVVLGLGRLTRSAPLRFAATSWVEFFRGIPLVLLMLYAFLGFPRLGLDLSPFSAAAFALVAYNSAILAEIVRAGVLSLDSGQREAALAVGLTERGAMRRILLPQALRRMVPALVTQLVTLLKDTSLATIITYDELLRRFELAANDVRPAANLQGFLLASAVFVAVNLVLSRFARRLEVRQRRRYSASAIAVTGVEDLTAV